MKLRNIAIAGLVSVTLFSCNDLEEYNPSGATAEAVWSTPEGFVTVVNSAYAEQRAWYGKEDGIFMSEAGSDLWYNRDKDSYANQLTYYSGLGPSTGNPNRAAWTRLWKGINQCNAGINRIDQAGFTNEAEKNKRLAELRFMRAFYYWHVVETWGGVMLKTVETTDPKESLTATRSSVEEFYDLIISDLQFAAENLPLQQAWGNEYSRASKKSALGFLARAYLSRAYYAQGAEREQYFTKARDVANEVISRKGEFGVDLWSSYADLWKPSNNKNNKEALYIISNATDFGLNYDNNGNRLYQVFQAPYNGRPGLVRDLANGYESSRRLMSSLHLLDLFDASKDARYNATFQEVWIANTAYTWTANDVATYGKDPSLVGKKINIGDTAMVATKSVIANKSQKPYVVYDRNDIYNANGTIVNGRFYVNMKKFMDPDRTDANAQPGYKDVIVMRLAEMYLISAEAEMQLGRNAEAADMINVLRRRAAQKTPTDMTSQMLVTASQINKEFILDERARELSGEHLRWFDLKRMLGSGTDGSAFAAYIKAKNPDITQVQNFHILRPIRQEELNTLLNGAEFGQNPGYN
ncbi:putative outer membrane starch-binding protein [Arcticibacter pallidicorallinus]|uniref:Putative outer membrane starch-binding protein n=1 Tax=Arcticibacter pallidicorallinus TaxID=1259464 RepID=A0A2T0U9H6_9SPHI|nr:RagB/SusD family nutrient uptake outer membrane protein [Arcticibacter pallidicorallinus]PRY54595.1 putative outer membrane starch-binding protein [Arcticibacter pallidicorallinus]